MKKYLHKEQMMKKYLFCILFSIVFFAGTSFAQVGALLALGPINFGMQLPQNIYLDNSGIGAGTEADPYGSFSEINWTTIAEWVEAGHAVNINLKRGAEWSEQLNIGAIGTSGSPVKIKSYGDITLADTIIDGLSIVVVNSSAQSGGSNLSPKNIFLDAGGSGAGTEADPYGSFSEINWTTIAEWVEAGYAVNINLKRGAEWSEQLNIAAIGTSDSPITIQPYGDTNLGEPIINGLSFVKVN
jgi:hypothetical protein